MFHLEIPRSSLAFLLTLTTDCGIFMSMSSHSLSSSVSVFAVRSPLLDIQGQTWTVDEQRSVSQNRCFERDMVDLGLGRHAI
ncbi:uncharacterized protein BDV14DRAFT_131609 [Aspergillus stella-maris]|uniref:uncharacterized protein n=1 Tax=Aspergillus stella-maris TaxID=1810926 RepID=UPI003CCCDFF7